MWRITSMTAESESLLLNKEAEGRRLIRPERGAEMKKYYVKAPISGWHEVDKEHFDAFVDHIRKRATPPTLTINELIDSRTRIAETV
jgi:hypothetical protein